MKNISNISKNREISELLRKRCLGSGIANHLRRWEYRGGHWTTLLGPPQFAPWRHASNRQYEYITILLGIEVENRLGLWAEDLKSSLHLLKGKIDLTYNVHKPHTVHNSLKLKIRMNHG